MSFITPISASPEAESDMIFAILESSLNLFRNEFFDTGKKNMFLNIKGVEYFVSWRNSDTYCNESSQHIGNVCGI